MQDGSDEVNYKKGKVIKPRLISFGSGQTVYSLGCLYCICEVYRKSESFKRPRGPEDC